LIDTMNLSALQGRAELYGKQRAWGTVGYILATLGIGLLLGGMDLRLVFGVYAVLMGGMLAFVWQLPNDAIRLTSSFSSKFFELIRAPAWRVTTLSLFVFGIGNSGMHNYLSIYLSQLGASETLIGSTWSLGAIAETGFMAFSGGLISRLGVRKILPLAFVLYGFRLLAYSFMTNPLVAVPIGLTHAITFAPFWLSAVILVNRISPQHLKATGQAMLVATMSLSSVVGSPIAGAILDSYGMPAVFRLFAACCFAAALIFVTGSRLYLRADQE
jgi:PPP family 3-phenylpropionic acid transporter